MNNEKVLVTGGSGLVGRHLKDVLPNAIYTESAEFDLTDINQTEQMIHHHQPDTIIHLAGRVGGLLDNLRHPVEYLEDNLLINTNLLKMAHKYNINKVICILSTCIYPDKALTYPMMEGELFSGPPPPSNLSYAYAKRCMAIQVESYIRQFNKNWCYVIPCNLYGEYDKYDERNSHFVSALIRKMSESDEFIELWGTGKPLRQFMYARDLAEVLSYMVTNDIIMNMNIAPPWVHSIDEIAQIAIESCKPQLQLRYDSTRPEGQFRKDVDSSLLMSIVKDLQFTTLERGIKKTYEAFNTTNR